MKFIFQLICILSPTSGPPGKTFFPQGKSFAPSQVKQILKLSLSFYVNLSFLRYLNSQGRIKKMVNSLDYTLLFQD